MFRHLFVAAALIVSALPSAASAQSFQFSLPQYKGQTPVADECSAYTPDPQYYGCQYPDGSYVTWLLSSTDWTILTYRDGPCAPPPGPCGTGHITTDGTAYSKAHGSSVAPGVSEVAALPHVPLAKTPDVPTNTPTGVAADIPPEFCGHWANHASVLDIDCSGVVKEVSDTDGFPTSINATTHDRAFVNCSNLPNPSTTPCDGPNGWGYQTSWWIEPSATTPGLLVERVVATNAPLATPPIPLNPRMETHTLTLDDGPLLRVDGETASTIPYCSESTPLDVQAMWCGA
jgi:hypothetical protein